MYFLQGWSTPKLLTPPNTKVLATALLAKTKILLSTIFLSPFRFLFQCGCMYINSIQLFGLLSSHLFYRLVWLSLFSCLSYAFGTTISPFSHQHDLCRVGLLPSSIRIRRRIMTIFSPKGAWIPRSVGESSRWAHLSWWWRPPRRAAHCVSSS